MSAVGVFVVFVLCVAYIVSGVLGTPLTSRPRNVKVELTATGGLFEGSAVTYRGVHVGRVTHIDFTPTGVQATAELTSSTKIPSDTRAVVRSLSPVGEQYLDLQPPDDHGPWLQDGSTIAATSTDIPKTLATTVIAVNKLLGQIDPKKLHTVLDEASKAFSGTSGDLAQLTDQGRLLVNDLNRYWPQADRLITNGRTVLDIGTDNAARIRRLSRDFKTFAAFLKGYNPELTRTLKAAPDQIAQIRRIVRDADAVLPRFLSVGAELTGLLASYDPHLRALLANFSPGLGVLAKAIRGRSLQLNIIGQRDHYCSYGTSERDPKSVVRRPMNPNGRCADPGKYLQRGAMHAPGPVR
ncbi:MlaD family protein [Nocardioides terrisoli]|uniref:MlaD family protein n=1 Tax=Nocardioides terrisoli TaxID=3388267 RepID=UPI00287BADF5|nr:MlaD family protein [Nocardioides marmorisolisilvae]